MNGSYSGMVAAIEAARTQARVPGVAFGLIASDGEVVAGLGVTSVEHPRAVTGATLFQIGSVGKTMTATAVLRLVDQGRLALDVPVRRYLPELQLADPTATETVTLRHLLTHQSGLPADLPPTTDRGDDALERLVAGLVELPVLLPPGYAPSYSSIGFALVGRILEVVTGATFEVALQRLLFDPLGLDQTCFFAEQAILQAVSVGHTDLDGRPVVMRPWQLPRAHNPAAGPITSAADLLRFLRFWLGDGTTPDGRRLVSAELLDQARAPQALERGSQEQLGLAWELPETGPIRALAHAGATIGQMAAVSVVPARGIAYCVLTNSTRAGPVLGAAAAAVGRDLLGLPAPSLETPSPGGPSAEPLASYAGVYTNPGEAAYTLTVDAGGLRAESRLLDPLILAIDPPFPQDPPLQIRLQQAGRFVVPGPQPLRGMFQVRADGAVDGMFLHGRFYRRTS